MKTLRIHCLQHVDFEGLGCIESWINANNHQLTFTKFYESDIVPSLETIDWLIVMGGPMGIYDDEQYPYLKKEKEFIKKAIEAEKTVLGICLGAQLIAHTLGATISKNPKKEIGWFDVQKSNSQTTILNNLDEQFSVFHWHGDTFSTPENAVNLYSSAACKNQAFLYKQNVLALQFHLEVTKETVKEMVKKDNQELQEATYIQSANTILNTKQFIAKNNETMFNILEYLKNLNLN